MQSTIIICVMILTGQVIYIRILNDFPTLPIVCGKEWSGIANKLYMRISFRIIIISTSIQVDINYSLIAN